MIGPGTQIGKYRLDSVLGSGGQAIVYAAHDGDLDKMVALKFPRLDLLADESLVAGWRSEAKAAAALDEHDHVCTIHEIGTAPDGRPFISMALYRGETLREVLVRGPLGRRQAARLAEHVADGLAFAHSEGVVHRDIKPSNIVVTPPSTARILDFGVALREGVSVEHYGDAPGTIAYMSPEQLTGASVDARSDVWSFGAVFFEMLRGRRLFDQADPLACQARIVVVTQAELREEVRQVPRPYREVILRCLQKSPDLRFNSGGELLEAMRELPGVRDPSFGAWAARNARRLTAGAGLAVGLWLLSTTPPGRVALETTSARLLPELHYVGVLPFESEDSIDAGLAAGVTEVFAQALNQLSGRTEHLWVLSPAELRQSQAVTLSEVQRAYPLDLIVRGRVRRTDAGALVGLELLDLSSGDPVRISSLTVPDFDLASLRSGGRRLLSRRVHLPSAGSGVEDTPDAGASPGYREYVAGLGALHQLYDPEELERAIDRFRSALAEDPALTPASRALCEALWLRYQNPPSSPPSMAIEAETACARAAEDSEGDPLGLVAVGTTLVLRGRAEQAIGPLLQASEIDVESADAFRWLGRAYEATGQLDEAKAAYATGIGLRPDVWFYRHELGLLYHYAELPDSAAREFRGVIDVAPENYRGYNALGAAFMGMSAWDSAQVSFARSLEVQENVLAYRNLGQLHWRVGRLREAREVLEAGLRVDPEDWWSWRWLAHARHWDGAVEREAVSEAWQKVVDLTTPRLRVNPNDPDALCGHAEALVQLGRSDEARRHLDRLATMGQLPPYNLFYMGRVFEMLGSRGAALNAIGVAAEAGLEASMVHDDPWLADLRADERFRSDPRFGAGD